MKKFKKIIIVLVALILFSGCVEKKSDILPTPEETPEQTVPISVPTDTTPATEKAKNVIELARQNLSEMIKVSADDIELLNVEEVAWPDSGLGYRDPNVTYLPVEVPGFKIFLSFNGTTYEYHSDYESVVPPPEKTK